MDLKDKKIGFAMCGSFCTFKKTLEALAELKKTGAEIFPIMSETAASTDTRFGKAEEFRQKIEEITGNEIIQTIKAAEPIGPKAYLDMIIVLPCTGNTLAKAASGIADSAVTMAIKAHLRNNRPVLLGVSTNDGLGTAAENIGKLLARKNMYFIPFAQDRAYDYLIQFNDLYPWCIPAHKKLKSVRKIKRYSWCRRIKMGGLIVV